MRKTHKETGPRNADELKSWIEANTAKEEREKMAVYDLDAAFVSPRDHLPYVIRPFDTKRKDGGVVIHEAKGLNGKRLVAYGVEGRVVELTEEQFEDALR
jgi:hypothetical protein